MNQVSRFCVCRTSLLRVNPFTRWSSEPVSSSLISNNPTSSNPIMKLISNFHHTFNYPPQIFSIPGNHFRKFSGESAAKRNIDRDYLNEEIDQVYRAINYARDSIEKGTLPPLDAVKIPADKFYALMEKLGRPPPGFRVQIRALEDLVEQTVLWGEHYKYGVSWHEFRDCYRTGGMYVGQNSGSGGIFVKSFESFEDVVLHTSPIGQYMIDMRGSDDTTW